MIDEWPQELGGALTPPSHQFAAWIGSGLSCELGYPSWPDIVRRLITRCEELGKPSADIAEIDRLLAKNRLPEAAEMAFQVLGRGAFQQVLSEAFDVAEEEKGQDACYDLLMIPFTVFVTTNYDRSLSMAAARLTAEGKLQRTHDVIYPGGSPDQLWRRSIHYLHCDINHISQIVMTDSTFGHAYSPTGPQRRIVETLANTFQILFIGTDFTDTDVRRVFFECKDIFQSGAQTRRCASAPCR